MNQEISRSDYSQSEKLIQIGAYLQDVRQEQGLSIEQIATKTMIQARLLRAIEAGNLDSLPEAIYVRGFIKRYAEFLGLNGNDVSKSFPLYPDTGDLEPAWQNSDVAQLRQTHLYLAYVALITVSVIGLGAVLTRLSNGDRPSSPSVVEAPASNSLESSVPSSSPETSSESTPSTPDPSISVTPDVAEPSETAVSDEVIATPPVVEIPQEDSESNLETELLDGEGLEDILQPSGLNDDLLGTPVDSSTLDKPIQVELELQDRSWLRVIVDGKQEFEGVLPEGTQRSWAAEDAIVVRAGNAGGVLAIFNGQEAEPMGNPGAVSERRFSTDDIGTAQRAAR